MLNSIVLRLTLAGVVFVRISAASAADRVPEWDDFFRNYSRNGRTQCVKHVKDNPFDLGRNGEGGKEYNPVSINLMRIDYYLKLAAKEIESGNRLLNDTRELCRQYTTNRLSRYFHKYPPEKVQYQAFPNGHWSDYPAKLQPFIARLQGTSSIDSRLSSGEPSLKETLSRISIGLHNAVQELEKFDRDGHQLKEYGSILFNHKAGALKSNDCWKELAPEAKKALNELNDVQRDSDQVFSFCGDKHYGRTTEKSAPSPTDLAPSGATAR